MRSDPTRVTPPTNLRGAEIRFGPGLGMPWSMTVRAWHRCPTCKVQWGIEHEAEWEYPRTWECPACHAPIPLAHFPGPG